MAQRDSSAPFPPLHPAVAEGGQAGSLPVRQGPVLSACCRLLAARPPTRALARLLQVVVNTLSTLGMVLPGMTPLLQSVAMAATIPASLLADHFLRQQQLGARACLGAAAVLCGFVLIARESKGDKNEAAEQGSQQRGGSGTWPLSLLRGWERQHERNREEGASLAMRFGRAHRSHVV